MWHELPCGQFAAVLGRSARDMTIRPRAMAGPIHLEMIAKERRPPPLVTRALGEALGDDPAPVDPSPVEGPDQRGEQAQLLYTRRSPPLQPRQRLQDEGLLARLARGGAAGRQPRFPTSARDQRQHDRQRCTSPDQDCTPNSACASRSRASAGSPSLSWTSLVARPPASKG